MLTYPIIIGLQQSLVFIRHALNSQHALIMHSKTYEHSNARLFSDLMMCSAEHEACLKTTGVFCQREKDSGLKAQASDD